MEIFIVLLLIALFTGFACVGVTLLIMVVEGLFYKLGSLILLRCRALWTSRLSRRAEGFAIEDEYPPRSVNS